MSIDMKQYLSQLKELSHVDRRLQGLKKELIQIPIQLETSGADYLALSHSLKEKEETLAAQTKERLGLEGEIKSLAEEAQNREKRLYAIKTQKEYQATLKEIAKIKQENKRREERVLTLMETGEKISQEITQLKSEIADKEGDFKKLEEELNQRLQTLKLEEKELLEKRPAILQGLPPAVLKKYELVKRRFADPIAGVRKGVCFGCNMNIPPQVYNEMLKTNDFRDCPNCHRMIYAEMPFDPSTELRTQGKEVLWRSKRCRRKP